MVNIFLYVLHLYILMQKQFVLDTVMLSPSVFYPVSFKNKDILLPNHILITTSKKVNMDSVISWFSHLAFCPVERTLCPLEEGNCCGLIWYCGEYCSFCGVDSSGQVSLMPLSACPVSPLWIGWRAHQTASLCSGCLCGPAHTKRMIVIWGIVV